jgi:predicted solute-binding protein
LDCPRKRAPIVTIYLHGELANGLMRMPFSFNVCIATRDCLEVKMAARAKLKRKSYFVDERALKRAKKALGVKNRGGGHPIIR